MGYLTLTSGNYTLPVENGRKNLGIKSVCDIFKKQWISSMEPWMLFLLLVNPANPMKVRTLGSRKNAALVGEFQNLTPIVDISVRKLTKQKRLVETTIEKRNQKWPF